MHLCFPLARQQVGICWGVALAIAGAAAQKLMAPISNIAQKRAIFVDSNRNPVFAPTMYGFRL